MAIEKSPDEVVELARQRIATRKAQAQQALNSTQIARFERERPWRAAFAGLLGVLLLALLFTPGMPLHWKMYAVVHGVCAQQHNIFLGDLQFPMCARNTGIYASVTISVLFLWFIGRGRAGRVPPLPLLLVLAAFVLIMAVDGFNSMFVDLGLPYLYEPRNDLRTLTGLGMGVALGVTLLLILNLALRGDVDDSMPVLGRWWELGALLVLDLLVLAALYGNLAWMYWPLAAIAWSGITGVLYAVNLLMVALALGYDGQVTSLRQLARPGTIALVTTLVMLLAFSAARFWLEARGIMI